MSGFHDVTEGTYYKYRSGIIRPVCLIIRYLELSHFRNSDLKSLGKFHPLGSKEQETAGNALFKLIYTQKGSPPIFELQAALHSLFDALLRSPGLKDDPLACSTEQALLLYALDANSYCSADALLAQCIAQEFCFKCIDIHIARLESDNAKNYIPFDDPAVETAEIAKEIASEDPVDSDDEAFEEDSDDEAFEEDPVSESEEMEDDLLEDLKDLSFMKSSKKPGKKTFSSVHMTK